MNRITYTIETELKSIYEQIQKNPNTYASKSRRLLDTTTHLLDWYQAMGKTFTSFEEFKSAAADSLIEDIFQFVNRRVILDKPIEILDERLEWSGFYEWKKSK